MKEADLKKDYAEAGVDLPELKDAPKEDPKAEEPKEPVEPTEPAKEPEEPEAPLQEPKEQRKRSIYDEYKEKKAEARTEKERADNAERERDELKQKLEAVNTAHTPEEKKEAADDLEAFAKEIGADPTAIRRMRELFLKDVAPKTDAELQQRLDRFEAWEKANRSSIEKQMFEDEFKSATPKLEKMFGKASTEEMASIKAELDKLSHSKEWHDKPLAYIAFEHQDTLAALVSPKKRGMESKDRKEAAGEDFEFDPNADYASMTSAQREKWEAEYKKATTSNDVLTDAQGRKIII